MGTALGVGLVGYGLAGQAFHAPVIAGVPGLQLRAIASSQQARLAVDWPQAAVVADPEQLVRRPDIDLVVIAAPNDAHFPWAEAALLAGKNVVVDKPFTTTLAQAQHLARLAQSQNKVLSVYQNRRWDADFLSLRAVLASGELGRVVFFESHFDRYRPLVRQRWREQAGAGGGLWPDLGAHLVDQVLQLFGPPHYLYADLAAQRDGAQTDDYFHVQLRYSQGDFAGLRVVLHSSMLAAEAAPRFRVHGSKASYVKWGEDVQEAALRAGARPVCGALDAWGQDPRHGCLTVPVGASFEQVQVREWPNQAGNYLAYYAAVRDAILGLGPNPVTPAQAVQTMALLELGRESAARHCELPVVLTN